MEPWFLVILLVLGLPLALAGWLIVRAVNARNRIDELSRRVDDLQIQVVRLTHQKPDATAAPVKPAPTSPGAWTICRRSWCWARKAWCCLFLARSGRASS